MPNIYLSICAILTFHGLLSDILSVVFVVTAANMLMSLKWRSDKKTHLYDFRHCRCALSDLKIFFSQGVCHPCSTVLPS